ncbi:hypothetical protein A3G56_02685 [Candidatus Falkowbacteria bacterium RIFCSPLOWO2_12_FULL_45_10]|uniref:Uncharacterized protein n=3 Tax=Candidatus Falkowiibacteriota TaxID=1752728 RepID=A0A1F5RWX8_9BACT|nr:MAG: hypothetical protein A3D54_04055 [Candidatus Falkowbacteria bacterium RIFCSPHIGHO2_02_FULL_45_15]OGF18817.1 MAG: hypothetical protein A3I35_03640 [Candidatus Falkowbacteria bacterium RIFCSPLOWO2_02_FULL_45_15]OGF19230.1 MAG: hypothetical protein A3G56_02685 [Candidatus Falkowbacteria bacterium RIFCSPLOWO2_12_FULL_45_10]
MFSKDDGWYIIGIAGLVAVLFVIMVAIFVQGYFDYRYLQPVPESEIVSIKRIPANFEANANFNGYCLELKDYIIYTTGPKDKWVITRFVYISSGHSQAVELVAPLAIPNLRHVISNLEVKTKILNAGINGRQALVGYGDFDVNQI